MTETRTNGRVSMVTGVGSIATSIRYVLILLVTLGCLGCEKPEAKSDGEISNAPVSDAPSQKNRWNQVLAHYTAIDVGMGQQEVRDILGNPDQINPLYEPKIYKPRRIGTTWFYMKDPKQGGDLADVVIAVRFDNSEKVARIDCWGLEGKE